MNALCYTCDKPIYVRPAHTRFSRHFCNQNCRADNVIRWIGFIKANAGIISRQDMADHIGIPKNTLRSWIFQICKMGVSIPFRCGPEPKEKAPKIPKPKVIKPVKENKVIAKKVPKPPKVVKPPKITQRREIKKAPVQYATKIRDAERLKYVRVDNKTIIQVDKTIPDEIAIENWYKKRQTA